MDSPRHRTPGAPINRTDLMITQNHTGRTRPYPLPTVLRAISQTIKTAQTSGNKLPDPHRIDWPHRIRGYSGDVTTEFPAALLGLESGRVAGIAAWARALHVARVTVFADVHQTTITVIGRTSVGPVIAVHDTVADWPLEPKPGDHAITVEELAAVAADVTSSDALAGAR